MYNGHQLHRMHHRQYFDYIRDRKVPGRPPRNGSLCIEGRPSLEYNDSFIDTSGHNGTSGLLSTGLTGDFSSLLGINIGSQVGQPESFDCLICKEKFNNEMARFNHLSNENNQCSMTLPVLFRTVCLICQKDLETVSYFIGLKAI